MNFRHLKYFVATAESGQVSKAASAMNISQSAITTAIKDLEIKIGSSLFLRNAKGMELTFEGRQFLQSAYDILEKCDQALRLSPLDQEKTGKVSIAVSYTVMGYFLPYHLDKIKTLYPNLEIEVFELTRESIEEGLISRRFDLAIVLTSNTNNPELETETLLRSTRRLWLPNGHPLAQQRVVGFDQIAEEPYIMLTVDEAAQTTMRYWSETNFRPNIRLRTASVEAVRSMVANGEGVTILSDMVYRPWSLEAKRILTTFTEPETPSMNIGFAWCKDKELSPAAEALVRYFHQTYLMPHG